MKIANNLYVSIQYILNLDSGEEVDRSPNEQPLGFIVGTGQVIAGLEKALMGRSAGDSFQVELEPEDAYGPVNPDLFQVLSKNQFPDDIEIKPEMVFEVEGPQGPMRFRIASVNDHTVEVDFNHPMAGKRLLFDTKIVEVRQATTEELAQLENLSSGCRCGGPDSGSCSGMDSGSCDSGCGCG